MRKGNLRRGRSRFAPPMSEDHSAFDMDSSQIHMLSNQRTMTQGGNMINQTQNYVLNQTKIYMMNPNGGINQDNSYDSVLTLSNESQGFPMSRKINQGSIGGYANYSNYTHQKTMSSMMNSEQSSRGYASRKVTNKNNIEGKTDFREFFLLINLNRRVSIHRN